MAKFKTTVTKKDGSTASGYIENDKGYYDDGTELSAGDSIIDAQNKVWTKGGSSGSGSSDPDAGLSMAEYGAKYGVSIPSGGGSSSSKGSYKVTGIDRPDRTGYLRSAKELAKLYDINYDMDAIRGIYDDATNAKYALLSKELEQGENDFYTNNAQANATLLDTLRKATSSAIATGASRGIAGAEQLGLMMEQQQAITEGATNLAQERANMADEIAAEKAENIIKALEYSDSLKTTLGNLSSNIYSADTQYDVGLLDWAAQMKNVEALLEQIASQERTNAAAQALDKELALLTDARERDEGAANRKAQKEMNDATIAGNKEAAAITAAGYAKGSGSGYNQRTWLDDVKDAQDAADWAYKEGNANVYIAARRQLTGESKEEIQKAIDGDPYFKNSKAWKKAQQSNNSTTTTTTNTNSFIEQNNLSAEVFQLRKAYSEGANSKTFKDAYAKASSAAKRTFDNNYR